jgi:hypothetical protein
MSAVDALQAALAGEHACIYGYGVVGGNLPDAQVDMAREALELHRARRAPLSEQIRMRNAEPVAALAAYELPFPVDDADSARDLAAMLEQRLAMIYGGVVALSNLGGVRRLATTALAESAQLAAQWSGDITALPGIDPVPQPE